MPLAQDDPHLLEQRGDEAVQLAGELQSRIARERRTVRALKDHLLTTGASESAERVMAPTRTAPLVLELDWVPLGECLRYRRSAPGTAQVLLELRGEVDLSGSLRLRQLVTELFDDGAHDLLLDLGEVSFMDSNGLSALLWVRRRALADGGSFAVTAVHPQLLRLLHVTKLTAILLPDREFAAG